MTTPNRRFANDDEAAQHWLTLLRNGDADQKIQAREQLAAIFERRGMLEEATDLLISNIHDGVRNADVFRWLARLYRARGDEVTAMQAAAEAAKLMAPATPAPSIPASAQRMSEPTLVTNAPAQPRRVESSVPAEGACPSCGYVNRDSRSTCKRCRAPLGPEESPVPETTQAPRRAAAQPRAAGPGRPRPWYMSTPAVLLASALCLPPLSLLFVWLRPWPRTWKIGATIPLGLWTVMWLAIVMHSRSGAPPSTASATPAPTTQAAVARSEPAPVQQSTADSAAAKAELNPTTLSPTPTTQPQAAQPAPKTAPPTVTPVPPTPTPEPPKVIVVNGGTTGVALRDAPGTGERVRVLRDGERLERVGDEEPFTAEKRWWKVRDAEAREGWAATNYLLRETDVDERARFLEYGRKLWRLASQSDKSSTELFTAMKNTSTQAQLVNTFSIAQRNAKTQAELQAAASETSTSDRGRKARQALIDVLGDRKVTAERIVRAIATGTQRDLDAASQAISASQTGMVRFAGEFVILALELRVDYEAEFKE